MSKYSSRQKLLWLTLLTTLAASIYIWVSDRHTLSQQNILTINSANKIAPKNVVSKAKEDIEVEVLQVIRMHASKRDIFDTYPTKEELETKSIETPPSPPLNQVITESLQIPQPLPTIPVLPFTYIGKLGQDGRYTVFLTMNGKSSAVKKGDVLAQLYRIEDIQPPMMTLTYLPTNIKQTMQIGESN